MTATLMKAVICTSYGKPDVLKLTQAPKPTPKNNEVLVRIKATAVNSGDVRIRSLDVPLLLKPLLRVVLGFFRPRRGILGLVYSGVVEEVGTNVTSFKTGDEVFGSTGLKMGTYAEYIAVKESSPIAHKPINASHDEAVSIIFGGQTALYFLSKAGLSDQSNPSILIYGSTGAVGVAALQIAKQAGAQVTSVCSTRGIILSKSLGSDEVITYDSDDINKLQKGYDIIFDAVGKANAKKLKHLLKTGGKFVTVGGIDTSSETKTQLQTLKSMYEQGTLKAVIDRRYNLDQIQEAHIYVDSVTKKGNVVINI